MTDRELLELAAKAAGMYVLPDPWPRDADAGWFYNQHGHGGGMFAIGTSKRWNPLTDDGQALRLAVKLGLQIIPRRTFTNDQPIAVAAAKWADELDTSETYYDGDPYAATRRAIVRAAAEIGLSLTEGKESQ